MGPIDSDGVEPGGSGGLLDAARALAKRRPWRKTVKAAWSSIRKRRMTHGTTSRASTCRRTWRPRAHLRQAPAAAEAVDGAARLQPPGDARHRQPLRRDLPGQKRLRLGD